MEHRTKLILVSSTLVSKMSVLEKLPCSLPSGEIPDGIDAAGVTKDFASKLSDLGLSNLCDDAIWRDLFAFTGSTRAFYGAEQCFKQWKYWTTMSRAGSLKWEAGSERIVQIGSSSWIEATYLMRAEAAPSRDCIVILSLANLSGQWKIWVIRSILNQLHGYPDVDHLDPPMILEPPLQSHGTQDNEPNFECAVIGAGQAGLSVAGRLAALGVSYVVIEKNKAIGDNWRLRYQSMKCEFRNKMPRNRRLNSLRTQYTQRETLVRSLKQKLFESLLILQARSSSAI
jgi:hypothetical protein